MPQSESSFGRIFALGTRAPDGGVSVTVAMARIEVEVVDGTYGQGGWMDCAGGNDRSVPVLKLSVYLESDLVGEVVIQTDAGRIDEGVGAEIPNVADDEAGIMVVDGAAAKEEIDIGMEPSNWVFHFGPEEKVFLAADMALVDGIGAAYLKGGPELAEGEESKIGAGSDS